MSYRFVQRSSHDIIMWIYESHSGTFLLRRSQRRSRRIAIRIIFWPNIYWTDRIQRDISAKYYHARPLFRLGNSSNTFHVFFGEAHRCISPARSRISILQSLPVYMHLFRHWFPVATLNVLSMLLVFPPAILSIACKLLLLTFLSSFLFDSFKLSDAWLFTVHLLQTFSYFYVTKKQVFIAEHLPYYKISALNLFCLTYFVRMYMLHPRISKVL